MSSLVSVIMATRNSAAYMGDALKSVTDNRGHSLEILVIDAQSSDDTGKIAGSFPGIRWINQQGLGLYAAWNQAIRESTGDYICFLDSDDLWTKHKVHDSVSFLNSHPEVSLTTAYFSYFHAPDFTVPGFYKPELVGRILPGRIPGTLMARRSVFDTVGFFDERFRIAGDVDWFARIDDAGIRMEVLPYLHLKKRLHGKNLTFNSRQNNRELLTTLHASIVRRRNLPVPCTSDIA